MQIEIDLDVYKALTLHLLSESESYNDVLRRLLSISGESLAISRVEDRIVPATFNILAKAPEPGAWLGNAFLPNGTQLRGTYKGRTFRAVIRDETWIDENGVPRKSPSEAAGAISGTNVNGWHFWYAKRPTDGDWHRLDEFRK